jgi:two-component system chemotaxis response regulator CheB
LNYIVVIATSKGGLAPLQKIVAALPALCDASIFVVQHIGRHASTLPSLLAHASRLPAAHAHDRQRIEAGHIYVAPPDLHMTLEHERIRLNEGPKVHHTRPAGDPLFISAARIYRKRVIGIVLTGGEGDGAEGLRMIKECGGMTLVQEPEEAEAPSMPRSAIAADHPTVLRVEEIAKLLSTLCA